MAAEIYTAHSHSSDETGVWEKFFLIFCTFLQDIVFHRFTGLKLRDIWEKWRSCIK